jgi:hypothetical protein
MTLNEYNSLTPWLKVHFQHCPQCDDYYDARDISSVMWHHEHIHRPDVQTGRGYQQSRLLAIKAFFVLSQIVEPIRYDAEFESRNVLWFDSLSDDQRAIVLAWQTDLNLLLNASLKGGAAEIQTMLEDW